MNAIRLKEKKRLPLWFRILTDLLIAALISGVFAVYYLLLPKKAESMGTLEGLDQVRSFALPADPLATDLQERLSAVLAEFKVGEEERQVLAAYGDGEKELLLTRCERTAGEGKIVYFSADIFVTDIRVLRTNVSTDENGTIVNRSVKEQAEQANALLALTGDTFGMSKDGVIVRNGQLYRDDTRTANDLCLLCADGTMKIYEQSAGYGFEDLSQNGIWQAFTFGPSLLDRNGNPKKNYNIAASHLSDLSYSHPRAAIGMVAPGHFVFVLVDGREMNGSKGADFPTLSEIMKNEGCSVAYNLDGGRSAVMVYDGQWVNAPYKNGRGVSDILYISKAPVLENKEEHA